MFSLDKLLDEFNKGTEPIIKYYAIGMWLITNDYNNDGYIVDIIICKGKLWEEAVKEAKEYENKIKNITEEKYIPLSVGKSVLEATKDISRLYDLLVGKEVFPDNEEILEISRKVKVKDIELGC